MPSLPNTKHRSNDEWIVILTCSLFKAAGRVIWLAILFPALSIPTYISWTIMMRYGIGAGMLTAIGIGACYAAWSALHPRSFQAWISGPVRRQFHAWWRYTRRWEAICTLHGLATRHNDRLLTPQLCAVYIGKHTDVLDVRVVTGQSVNDWHKQTRELAAAWRADKLTVRATTPGQLRITITRFDFLAKPIPLPRPSSDTGVNLLAVPVGFTDTRRWWRVPVLGHHLLVAGATGSGKGSVLWSLIAGLAPAVIAGQVRLCVIDPKGGMELGAGTPLFGAFAHDATDSTPDLLRSLVAVMHARANRLRGHTRLHTPTPEEPLYVIIIDEIAALTAYVADRKIRAEIEQLLGLLLSQGRAVGMSVVAAIQDPSKDTLPLRQLFTVRVGLRMTEATQTAMVLGQSARDAGAECDLIADATPGVGYVMIDGTAHPQRVRAFHVTDTDISDLTTRFSPPGARRHGLKPDSADAGPDGSEP